MNFKCKLLLLAIWAVFLIGCDTTKNNNTDMNNEKIMEVTTFNITSDTSPLIFEKRDMEIESVFTSKQSGFVKRQSGVDDEGNYVVVVFWDDLKSAETSMSKFMNDESVADYAKMIDASSMKMSRYTMNKKFNADASQFVEIMAFDVKPGTDMTEFDGINQRVETEFTGLREGFLQRLTGANEQGTQVVAVYWSSKALSDASLNPFMAAPVSKEFMGKMDQASMSMGRYKFLNRK